MPPCQNSIFLFHSSSDGTIAKIFKDIDSVDHPGRLYHGTTKEVPGAGSSC